MVIMAARDEIDPTSPTPVYRQLAEILADRIAHGVLKPGPMPSELHMQQEFGVARDTVRKALGLLRERGLIVTVQGRGSFVTRPS